MLYISKICLSGTQDLHVEINIKYFVCRFILEDLWNKKKMQEQVQEHWRPQWTKCPYCSFNFTVYAQMETLSADEQHFSKAAKITSTFLVRGPFGSCVRSHKFLYFDQSCNKCSFLKPNCYFPLCQFPPSILS